MRKFRRNPEMWQATLTREATVISCLLEYGEKITGKSHFVDELQTSLAQSKKDKKRSGKSRRGSEGDVEKQLAKMSKQAAAEEEEKAREAAALAERMKASMAASGEDVSGANVGRVVGLQGDAMRTAAEAYSKQSEEIQKAAVSGDMLLVRPCVLWLWLWLRGCVAAWLCGCGCGCAAVADCVRPAQSTKLGKAQAHKRRVAVLSKSAATTEARTKVAAATVQKVSAQLQNMMKMLTSANKYVAVQPVLGRPPTHAHACALSPRYNERVLSETAKLEKLATASQHQDDLGRLRQLVTLNESLKSQESQFRANCKQQLASLDVRIVTALVCAWHVSVARVLMACVCVVVQATLASLAQATNPEEDARLQEIEDMYADVRGHACVMACHGRVLSNAMLGCRCPPNTTSSGTSSARRTRTSLACPAPSMTCQPDRSSSSTSAGSWSCTTRWLASSTRRASTTRRTTCWYRARTC